jgi:hypothetical protein
MRNAIANALCRLASLIAGRNVRVSVAMLHHGYDQLRDKAYRALRTKVHQTPGTARVIYG